MTDEAFDPYAILGVERSSSEEQIRHAYKKAAQAAHPDRPGGNAERMSQVNQAWQILSDADRRAKFDAGGGTETIVNLERRAKDFLLHQVGIAIRLPIAVNMIAAIFTSITNQKASLAQSRLNAQAEIAGLRERLTRIKGPPDNFIEDQIKQEIVKGERLLLVMEADELVMGKAQELLKDFSWEEAAQQSQTLLSAYGQPIFAPSQQHP